MKRLSMALGLALCVALPASAELYKWVDSDGRVQYSDKPPPSNIKTEKLGAPTRAIAPAASEGKGETEKPGAPARAGTPATPPVPGASEGKSGTPKDAAKKDAAKAAPKTAVEQDQAFRKRQLDAAKAQQEDAKKQADARDRAENCTRAKAALANLQMGGRQVRIDEKGERVFLEDQQIAQETAKARDEAAAACK
jgi:hypothetical protein